MPTSSALVQATVEELRLEDLDGEFAAALDKTQEVPVLQLEVLAHEKLDEVDVAFCAWQAGEEAAVRDEVEDRFEVVLPRRGVGEMGEAYSEWCRRTSGFRSGEMLKLSVRV